MKRAALEQFSEVRVAVHARAVELRCLYCGHACDSNDPSHHQDPLRDEHRPCPTGSRDPYVDASTPASVPTSNRRRPPVPV